MARLIDADALPIWGWTMAWEEGVGIRRCLEAIDRAPTIDPVKHGRWINEETCSVCGESFIDDTDYFNYCPNCGAKMDKEEE